MTLSESSSGASLPNSSYWFGVKYGIPTTSCSGAANFVNPLALVTI